MTGPTVHDEIAAFALEVCERVREHNPHLNLAHYTALCARRPVRAAQIMLALAIWVDLDVPLSALGDRAEAVAAGTPPVPDRKNPRS